MFNKIVNFIKLTKEIKFVLKVEHLFYAKLKLSDVFNYIYKGKTIEIQDGLKTIYILQNEKTLRKNSFVYILKSDSKHKKVWLKPLEDGRYDFLIFDFSKVSSYNKKSKYAEFYYPIYKNTYDGYRYLINPLSSFNNRGLDELEIESIMM